MPRAFASINTYLKAKILIISSLDFATLQGNIDMKFTFER